MESKHKKVPAPHHLRHHFRPVLRTFGLFVDAVSAWALPSDKTTSMSTTPNCDISIIRSSSVFGRWFFLYLDLYYKTLIYSLTSELFGYVRDVFLSKWEGFADLLRSINIVAINIIKLTITKLVVVNIDTDKVSIRSVPAVGLLNAF